MLLKLNLLFLIFGICKCHKLAVYWGQDPAGSLKLTLEKSLDYYCSRFDYDVIPIAFLDFFFYPYNKDHYPSVNFANHCNKTFDGYPGLLDCPKIGASIKKCQQLGKKIIISLGGSAGSYSFSSSSKAVTFASTIWRLFLGGESTVRPFGDVVLDGVDLDIEAGTTMYYVDFVQSIRELMNTDQNKKYLITGAPQCPFPDVVMGPGSKGTVLHDIPQEFDYLFVQFYNNYCYLGSLTQFNSSMTDWLNFADQTKQSHGKGPLIFIGLPSHPRASSGSRYYRTPEQVEAVYTTVKYESNIGGIMLWDASFDLNNVIDGRPYSSHLKDFLKPEERKSFTVTGGLFIGPLVLVPMFCVVLCTILVVFFLWKRKTKKGEEKTKGNSEKMDIVFLMQVEKV